MEPEYRHRSVPTTGSCVGDEIFRRKAEMRYSHRIPLNALYKRSFSFSSNIMHKARELRIILRRFYNEKLF